MNQERYRIKAYAKGLYVLDNKRSGSWVAGPFGDVLAAQDALNILTEAADCGFDAALAAYDSGDRKLETALALAEGFLFDLLAAAGEGFASA